MKFAHGIPLVKSLPWFAVDWGKLQTPKYGMILLLPMLSDKLSYSHERDVLCISCARCTVSTFDLFSSPLSAYYSFSSFQTSSPVDLEWLGVGVAHRNETAYVCTSSSHVFITHIS